MSTTYPDQTESKMPLIDTYAPEDVGRILNDGIKIANTFLQEGRESLNANLLRGEKEAIGNFIGGVLAGSNILLISVYGAGKTELVSHGFKIISGIHPENVVFVPGRIDLTPGELVGKSQEIETMTEQSDGSFTKQRQTGVQDPMIKQTTQALVFDEANRGAPRTLDAAAQITGSRMLETRNGKVPMNDLEFSMFAMNPTESLRTTSKLSGAIAARLSFGMILAEEKNWDDILTAVVDDEFQPTPEKITPVISLDQLHVAQAAVRLVTIPSSSERGDDQKGFLKRSVKASLIELRDHELNIGEAPGRFARQLMTGARALALMNGRSVTNEGDIQKALQLKIIAELGGNGIGDLNEINSTYQSILSKAR